MNAVRTARFLALCKSVAETGLHIPICPPTVRNTFTVTINSTKPIDAITLKRILLVYAPLGNCTVTVAKR